MAKKTKKNKQTRKGLYVFFFSVIAIISAVAVSYMSTTDNRSHAATLSQPVIANLTNSTVELKGRMALYGKGTIRDKMAVKALAQSRRDLIVSQLEASRDNPVAIGQIMKSLNADNSFSQLSPAEQKELENVVEHPIAVTGILSTIHGDTDEGGKSEEYLQIVDTSGKSYRVFTPKEIPLEEGKVLNANVSGLVLGGDVVAPASTMNTTTAVTTASAIGGKKILAILMSFSNSTAADLTITQSAVTSQLFTDPNSVKNYLEKSSYYDAAAGRGVTIDVANSYVHNWIKLSYARPTSESACSSNLSNWATDANSKVTLPAGKTISSYDHIIYIFPRETNCAASITGGPFSGWGDIPGKRVWINGLNHVRVYTHELQHNFGLPHATAIDCGTKPIAPYANCKTAKSADLEYMDVYDNMGSGGKFNSSYTLSTNTAIQTNAAYKLKLGWLSSARVQTVTASNANVTLLPYETFAASGTQVIKIPATKLNSADNYYVEYRTPTNVDNAWPISALSPGGIVVRLYGNSSIFHSSSPPVTAIVDTVSPYSTAPYNVQNFYDSALKKPGTTSDTFIDPVNNVVIKLKSLTSAGAVLCVGIGNTSYCNSQVNPTPIPPSPTPTGVQLSVVSNVPSSSVTRNIRTIANAITVKNNTAVTVLNTELYSIYPENFGPSNNYYLGNMTCAASVGTATFIGGTGPYCDVFLPSLAPGQQIVVTWTGQIQNILPPLPFSYTNRLTIHPLGGNAAQQNWSTVVTVTQ